MSSMSGAVGRLDGYQQRHRWAGLAFAVYKKFGDDQAGNLAALISYYLFSSVFPLLLAVTTVLGYVLGGHPALEQRVYDGALRNLPIVGQYSRLHPLTGNALGLVVGLVVGIWSGLAVARQAQNAFAVVWDVPRVERPGYLPRLLRSAELVAVVGGGLVLATLAQGLVSASQVYGLHLGAGTVVLAAVIGIVVDVAVLAWAFRRGSGLPLDWRRIMPGAVTGGTGWFLLQKFGSHLVNRRVAGARNAYGTCALVIGLLFYFFLLAQVTLYSAELNVVLAKGLWPRGLRTLTGVPTTEADQRAYEAYPQRERQAHHTDVDVEVEVGSESAGPTEPTTTTDT